MASFVEEDPDIYVEEAEPILSLPTGGEGLYCFRIPLHLLYC